jgi:hypothetical protein
MPEAFSESHDLIQEIRRLRPEWLRARPDLAEMRRLKNDWTRKKRGFWQRLGQQREIMPPAMMAIQAQDLMLAREEASQVRQRIANEPRGGEHTPLQEVFGIPPHGTGWETTPVEYWRVPTYYHVVSNLTEHANPYAEWTDGTVDLTRMFEDSNSLHQFFFRDASATRLPRAWLRASFEFLQTWRHITDGTPGDAQLASYLADADFAVSADRNFVTFANRCNEEGPLRCARAHLLPGGPGSSEALLSLLPNL